MESHCHFPLSILTFEHIYRVRKQIPYIWNFRAKTDNFEAICHFDEKVEVIFQTIWKIARKFKFCKFCFRTLYYAQTHML